MKKMLIHLVILVLFVAPVSTFAVEDHFQVLDTAASTQLIDDESGNGVLPIVGRSAEHCGHCVSVPLHPESSSTLWIGNLTPTHQGKDYPSRFELFARTEKPPRY